MKLLRWFFSLLVVVGLAALAVVLFNLMPRYTYHALEGLRGPLEKEFPAPLTPVATWDREAAAEPSRLALLLTDPDSAWTGVQHALDSMGIPYVITDDVERAVRHRVVLVYPMISGRLLNYEKQESLRRHVREGGCLLATQVLGDDLKDLFGYDEVLETRRRHYEVKLSAEHELTRWLVDARERTVRLGNPDHPETWIGTQYYTKPEETLASYQDGQAAWITKQHPGGGRAMALGFDLGFFILKCQNDRDEEASRDYVNAYEPSVDVWLRLLRHVYQEHEPLAVTVDTVPDGKRLTAVMSFDIDYVKSLQNIAPYQELLTQNQAAATYFIQTKYFRDYLDSGFFNDSALDVLRWLRQSGAEISSHSVCHSKIFNLLPLGTGTEMFPDYQPRVHGEGDTRGATVLGELRVSKFLLEHLIGVQVRSFRPGHLACPPSLPQALEATGYRYASSVTAANVMTYLPYRKNYNRQYGASTSVFEFPVAIEDEHPPEMDQRADKALDLANQLAQYGGTFIVLSHPNILGYKFRFFEKILPKLRPMAWIGTIGQLGDWWQARDRLEIDVTRRDRQVNLTVTAPERIQGVTLHVPDRWKAVGALPLGARLEGGRLFLPELDGRTILTFQED